MHLIFQEVEVSELEILCQLSRDTFRATYEQLNDPQHFQEYLEQAFSYNQLEKEWRTEGSHFYFAYAKKELAGYFKLNFGKADGDLRAKTSTELERIYLKSNFQNKGLGSQLIEKACDLARQAGYSDIWLGVWQKNPKAIRFYQRQGFSIFGAHDFYVGSDRQQDWLMKRNLKLDDKPGDAYLGIIF